MKAHYDYTFSIALYCFAERYVDMLIANMETGKRFYQSIRLSGYLACTHLRADFVAFAAIEGLR